jgi:hypothetical protein
MWVRNLRDALPEARPMSVASAGSSTRVARR